MPGTSVTQDQHTALRSELRAQLRAHREQTKGEIRILAAEIRYQRLEAEASRDEQRDDHAEVLRQLTAVTADVKTLSDAALEQRGGHAVRARWGRRIVAGTGVLAAIVDQSAGVSSAASAASSAAFRSATVTAPSLPIPLTSSSRSAASFSRSGFLRQVVTVPAHRDNETGQLAPGRSFRRLRVARLAPVADPSGVHVTEAGSWDDVREVFFTAGTTALAKTTGGCASTPSPKQPRAS